MSERYVLEGEWSGYVSRQRRVVHREVISKNRAEQVPECIIYTDGTTLNLTVRKAAPREKVAIINGYNSLIWKAQLHGGKVVSVTQLQ